MTNSERLEADIHSDCMRVLKWGGSSFIVFCLIIKLFPL